MHCSKPVQNHSHLLFIVCTYYCMTILEVAKVSSILNTSGLSLALEVVQRYAVIKFLFYVTANFDTR